MIKVLIVEDSRTVSQYLEYILESDSDIKVIGNVANGQQAIDFINKEKPDIISMDIDMPVMNGLDATRIIMSTNPIPIVVVTATRNASDINVSIEAMAAGALGIIHKPLGIGHPDEEQKTKKMLSLIKAYSQVRVITRKPTKPKQASSTLFKKLIPLTNTNDIPSVNQLLNRKYVAIGISSGGPQVLENIFASLTVNFPYPILVVQHIALGFMEGLVSWLARTTKIPIHIASHNEPMLPGHIYFAPNNFQMGIKSNRIDLKKPITEKGICPSAKHLFESLIPEAKKTIAIILTGMGKDGSQEIKTLKDAGALTIAQDNESSLIHGMPGEAIKLGGASYILSSDQVSDLLQQLEIHSKLINILYNI